MDITEILSDDDDVSMVVDKNIDSGKMDNAKSYNGKPNQIEIIVVDDEIHSQSDNNNETNNRHNLTLDIDSIYKENQLLAEFIEKCINLEHSEGMLRIINRTLLRVYKETDEKYKKSPEFEKVLQKQINIIETEPHRKFTHMRTIIEALKSNRLKKRVRLKTLATNLKRNNNSTIRRCKKNNRIADFGERIVKKSKCDEIIDLDSDPNDVIPVINLDEDQNDVIVLDEPARIDVDKENNIDLNKRDDDDNHEHKNSQNDSEENSFLTPQIEVYVHHTNTDQDSMIAEPIQSNKDHNGQLDVPMTTENVVKEEDEHRDVEREIRKIENQIEKCKQIVQQLDEAEVTKDNMTSPYIISEKVKAKIVSLYKTLCELTGSESVKKRTVRLQVQDGHPAGPVRRLEEFINSNIGEDGDPLFPDCRDVTMCVLEANEADGLGWSKGQVLKEASALFTQCGRALQRRRQKREWRDLLATVKSETLEYDPADEDPILQAKLEQNRRMALCKENELFDRYSKMQDMPARAKLNKVSSQFVTQNCIRIIDSCENMNIQNGANNIINDTNNTFNDMNCQKPANITIEVPSGNKENHGYITNKEFEAINTNCVVKNTHNSLAIIKTEVSVVFEPPERDDQVPGKRVESLNLDVKRTDEISCSQRIRMENVHLENDTNESHTQIKTESLHLEYENNTNIVPFSQRIQMEEDSPFENDERQLNVEIENEIAMEVESDRNESHLSCLDDLPSCQLAASSNTNVNNEDSDTRINRNITFNITEDNSQEDISKKKLNTSMQNVVKDPLVNEETDCLDKAVKIKKEPVDILALLDSLGDNFSADIVDIEDPFLVIEISDSSDEE